MRLVYFVIDIYLNVAIAVLCSSEAVGTATELIFSPPKLASFCIVIQQVE